VSIIKEITSTINPIVKQIGTLEEKKKRRETGLFKAEGVRTVTTLLESGLSCKFLLATEENMEILKQFPSIKERFCISHQVAQKLTGASTPSGVFGVFHIPETTLPSSLSAGLVLAQISDPGNMGTLIRTSVAMGFKQIICVECTDPFSTKAVSSTAGTLGKASIIICSWPELIAHQQRPPLCALVVDGGQSPASLNEANMLLVVGNEAHGLPVSWEGACEKKITLPMPGNTESLNAAIAGCIALYELSKLVYKIN
jgi:TrmH family RNA methyltransferase